MTLGCIKKEVASDASEITGATFKMSFYLCEVFLEQLCFLISDVPGLAYKKVSEVSYFLWSLSSNGL